MKLSEFCELVAAAPELADAELAIADNSLAIIGKKADGRRYWHVAFLPVDSSVTAESLSSLISWALTRAAVHAAEEAPSPAPAPAPIESEEPAEA